MDRIGSPSDYARFLCAVHRSFAQAKYRFNRRFGALRRKPPGKPWKRVLGAALRASPHPSGIIMEFGVYKGTTLRFLASTNPNRQVHGFDSFTGFPDDGRSDWRADFAVDGLPQTPQNARLHKGWFSQTLPAFIQTWPQNAPPIALVHIDCDIYSSTRAVLAHLAPYLKPGDVLVFDELLNYSGFATNEMLALYEFLCARNLDFEWLVTYGKPFPFASSGGVLPVQGMQEFRNAGYYQNHALRLCTRASGQHFAQGDAPADVLAAVSRSLTTANHRF